MTMAMVNCQSVINHDDGQLVLRRTILHSWRELSGVLCDQQMPIAVKEKVYKTMVRPVMIYGAQAWPWEEVKRGFLKELKWECSDGCLVSHGRAGKEMMTFAMLLESFALHTSWQGTRVKTEMVRTRPATRRWPLHQAYPRSWRLVMYGHRNRTRQRKRWINAISWQDLISLNLTPVDAEDRDDWRRRTSEANPSPEGFTAWRRERETIIIRGAVKQSYWG